MGKEPIGSKVTILQSGTQCCLGPLFRVNQPSKNQLSSSLPVLQQDDQKAFLKVWRLITCSNTL